MEKLLKHSLFFTLLLNLVFGFHEVHAVPYDYSFTPECLAKPLEPQYRGGIVVNPELDQGLNGWTNFADANIEHRQSQDGNNFIVASANRRQTFQSFTQKFYLEPDKLYTFSAWLQVSDGEADVKAVFKTEKSYENAGWVIAKKGCWSMLKGGLTVGASGPAELFFENHPLLVESNNTKVEIWADSISLQSFTHQEWKSHQDQSIQKYRKRSVKVQALDQNGRPIANGTISIKATRPGFPIGTAINQNILRNTAYQNWFSSRFKYTVFENELKWYSNERTKGVVDYSVSDALLQFATSKGAAVRGHVVFWDNPKQQPSWVGGLGTNTLRQAVEQRINSVMRRYSGKLFHWDIENENLHFNFFESKLGPNTGTGFYQEANKIDPKTIPFLNEYNTIEQSSDGVSSPAKYLQKISQIRQQGYKGPLGIGLQGHFTGNANLPYIRSAIDTLASSKLPIWITELDVSPGSNQVTLLQQILEELRGHQAIQGIMLWTAWSPQGCYQMCLTDNSFNNLATGNVVDKFRLELAQDAEGTTDARGIFKTTLYHGEYEVKVSHSSGIKSPVLNKLNVRPSRRNRGDLRYTIKV